MLGDGFKSRVARMAIYVDYDDGEWLAVQDGTLVDAFTDGDFLGFVERLTSLGDPVFLSSAAEMKLTLEVPCNDLIGETSQ
jgi:hypothetical protein